MDVFIAERFPNGIHSDAAWGFCPEPHQPSSHFAAHRRPDNQKVFAA